MNHAASDAVTNDAAVDGASTRRAACAAGRRHGQAPALGSCGGLLLSLVLLAAPAGAAPRPAGETRVVEVSDDFRVLLVEGAVLVEVRQLEGETLAEFTKRVARDTATAKRVTLSKGPCASALLPYGAISDELRRATMTALFPSDVRAVSGWLHIAIAEESVASIAEWFTGSAGTSIAIAAVNGLKAPTIPRGATVRIPTELLAPVFRDAPALSEETPVKLEYDSDAKGRYAVYRLRRKEALYSAVVVRFTGRIHAEDVVQLALKIAIRSDVDDVHAIPVGYPIKIPLELLSPEFLPRDDPRAQEAAKEKAEASLFAGAAPPGAKGLVGVRVVIDAGHGGRDTGTIHEGIWESTYVYDVACRLRKLLADGTHADVVMTTKEPGLGWQAPDKDAINNRRGHVVLTTPPYRLDDPVVGVNLRWYLANSLLKRPGKDKKAIPPERTVFLSIHADSLHPAVRGAMAYVPGERFLRDRHGKRGAAYTGYREVRDQPVVSFDRKERLSAEGVSTRLAEKLIRSIGQSGLPVHEFSPVRTHVIRGGREWVPAVLRYNRIPNRVLLEIANLGNEDDRALMVTRAFRQRVAESIAAGLLDFFGGAEDKSGSRAASGGPKSGKIAPLTAGAPARAGRG